MACLDDAGIVVGRNSEIGRKAERRQVGHDCLNSSWLQLDGLPGCFITSARLY